MVASSLKGRPGIADAVERQLQEAIERHYEAVRGLLAYFARDRHTADDLTQEVFVRLCVAFRQQQEIKNAWALIRGIMRNVCLEHGRSRRHGPVDIVPEGIADDKATGPQDAVEQEELLRKLAEGWKDLTDEERAVVVGKYFFDLTGEQLAASLGTPRRTLLDRLDKAVGKLRTFLGCRSG